MMMRFALFALTAWVLATGAGTSAILDLSESMKNFGLLAQDDINLNFIGSTSSCGGIGQALSISMSGCKRSPCTIKQGQSNTMTVVLRPACTNIGFHGSGFLMYQTLFDKRDDGLEPCVTGRPTELNFTFTPPRLVTHGTYPTQVTVSDFNNTNNQVGDLQSCLQFELNFA